MCKHFLHQTSSKCNQKTKSNNQQTNRKTKQIIIKIGNNREVKRKFMGMSKYFFFLCDGYADGYCNKFFLLATIRIFFLQFVSLWFRLTYFCFASNHWLVFFFFFFFRFFFYFLSIYHFIFVFVLSRFNLLIRVLVLIILALYYRTTFFLLFSSSSFVLFGMQHMCTFHIHTYLFLFERINGTKVNRSLLFAPYFSMEFQKLFELTIKLFSHSLLYVTIQ